MSKNNYSWNETLKFSWGHIIAFIALIFISYVAYMGDFYMNGGDFKSSALKVLLINIALLITFIGAQIYKGADKKFNRSIIIERVLICLTPFVFVWTMIPYNHFWNVFNQREQIETQFNSAITKSKQMFVDYDTYANDRIATYQQMLETIIAEKQTSKELYTKAGFTSNNDGLQKETYVHTLRLQLLSQNTNSLKNQAMKWIDNANQDASVWNAFLVGNIQNISEAITRWNQTLISYSEPILSNETVTGNEVKAFDTDKTSIKIAISDLKSLINIYEERGGINLISIITAFVLFLMLLFPYFLQKRNTRANGLYFLLPQRERKKTTLPKSQSGINENIESIDNIQNDNHTSSDDDDIFGGTF